MKKYKVIILLLSIILLCGCSGTYNLNINEDLSVVEKIDLDIDKGDGVYQNTLKLFEENKIEKSKYKIVSSENNVKIIYSEKYNSIEEYILESKIHNMFFDNIQYNKDRKKIDIYTTSYFKLNNSGSDNIVNDYDISLLQINVTTPYKINKTNADSTNDNTMTWLLKKDTTKKSIDFSLNVDSKNNSYVQIIVLSLIGIIIIGSIVVIVTRMRKSRKI